ncbi:MAG: polyprenyl synthetase family protein [archaeon]
MLKEEYKKLMLETSKKIEPVILGYIEPLKNENQELYKICLELLKKKIGTFETRAYLLRNSFEVCSGKKWTKEIMHACAAIELELASMYYANRIFDDKGGKKILNQPKNQFIAAMITRDLASQALTKSCSKADYKTFVRIKDIFDEINKICYIGQFYEVSYNIYKPSMKLEFDHLLKLYYKRNYGVNNSFFEKIGMIGAILGSGTEKQIEALASFGKNYGMMLQIINDIGDFVPPKLNTGTEEKLSEDAYSDIKHGKLTLPIIYSLTHKSKEENKIIIESLSNPNIDKDKLIKVTKILMKNGSIDFSKKIALDFINQGKNYLKIFPKEKRMPLSTMEVIAWTNRYYKALSKFKE